MMTGKSNCSKIEIYCILNMFSFISYSCWLDMSDKFIWSFAGPITFAGILNVSMFMMSVKAFCRDKITVSDIAAIRYAAEEIRCVFDDI